MTLRKVTTNHRIFPSDEAVFKVIAPFDAQHLDEVDDADPRLEASAQSLCGGICGAISSMTKIATSTKGLTDSLVALEAGMYLIGCTYNFCWPHQELGSSRHVGHPCTPAMASGLTDHIWSVAELLTYKVAPSPWVEPKRRGRPRKRPLPDPAVPKRPRGRPRKVA